MLAATIVGVLLLMLGTWPLSMSPMIFDSGESMETWSLFIAIWLMPVALIAGIAIGWIGLARNTRGIVTFGLALAALPLLVLVGVLAMAGV
jgi:hypothetical protein